MTAHTSNALASALPDHIRYIHPRGGVRLTTEEVAALQAERLAESGYVLVHTAPDEATVERLAERLLAQGGHAEYASEKIREVARDDVRIILAALADTPAQANPVPADDATEEDEVGECTCTVYVVDYSDPERYHPENLDTELTPGCPEHDPEGVAKP